MARNDLGFSQGSLRSYPLERVVGFETRSSAGGVDVSTARESNHSALGGFSKESNPDAQAEKTLKKSLLSETNPSITMHGDTVEQGFGNKNSHFHELQALKKFANKPVCATSEPFASPALENMSSGLAPGTPRTRAIPIPSHTTTKKLEACSNDTKPRVLRRVPEPPITPAAVTAPAVVQQLLAAQVDAAAQQMRAQQQVLCQQNMLEQAYEVQERLRALQFQASRLKASIADPHEYLGGHGRPQAKASLSSAPVHTRSLASTSFQVNWESWYSIPHGNLAAADYCAGAVESRHTCSHRHCEACQRLQVRRRTDAS